MPQPYGENTHHRRETSRGTGRPHSEHQSSQYSYPQPTSPQRVWTIDSTARPYIPPLSFQPEEPEPDHRYSDEPSHYQLSNTPSSATWSSSTDSYRDHTARPPTKLREPSPYSDITTDLWASIWMHPKIGEVVEQKIQQLVAGQFNYIIPYQLMHIFDLQTVYLLSNAAWCPNSDKGSFPRIRFPDNALLQPTQAIRCAEILSQRHVNNHIKPSSYLEREIQLRALVSVLSYLQLCTTEATATRLPQISHTTEAILHRNIRELSKDLYLSNGAPADFGDCEFLLRYARNLLSSFRSDQGTAVKTAAGFANFVFAVGHASQYNGAGAVVHLRKAFTQINPQPDRWHAGFDDMHHICMIVLSWSQYSSSRDSRSAAEFRAVCSDMIAQLRAKLKDGIAKLDNAHGAGKSIFWKKMTDGAAHLAGVNPIADNPTHLTYGLMYLIGRLVERMVADGGGQTEGERDNIKELVAYLVEICQTTKFDEIRYKAYEILFMAFGTSRSDLLALQNMTEIKPYRSDTHYDHQRRIERNKELRSIWNQHMNALMRRAEWVDGTLTQLRHDDTLKQMRAGVDEPVLKREQWPPKLRHDSSFGQKMIAGIKEHLSIEHDNDIGLLEEAKNSLHSMVHEFKSPSKHGKPAPTHMSRDPSRESHRSHHSGRSHHTPEMRDGGWGPHHSPDMRAGGWGPQPSTSFSQFSAQCAPSSSGSQNHPRRRAHPPLAPVAPAPPPLNFRSPAFVAPLPRARLSAPAFSSHLSPTARTICFLTSKTLHLFTLHHSSLTPLTTFPLPAPRTPADPRSFTSAAVTDTHLAALTPSTCTVLGLAPLGRPGTITAPDGSRFTSVALTGNCLALASASATGVSITLHTLPTLELSRRLRVPPGELLPPPWGEARFLTFSPSGAELYCALSARGYVLCWDLEGRSSSRPARCVLVPVNDGAGNGKAGITGLAGGREGEVVVITGGEAFVIVGEEAVEVSGVDGGVGVGIGERGEWGVVTRGGKVWGGRGAERWEVGVEKLKGGMSVGWEGGDCLVMAVAGDSVLKGSWGGVWRVWLNREGETAHTT